MSVNSLASNIRFLSAKLTGINPSISMSIFLNMLAIFLIYSLSANITWAFNVNDALKLPIGSCTIFPLSKINSSSTISISCMPSGIVISLTCMIEDDTSFAEIPAYLSFASLVIVFCTIVTYLPGIVT